MTFCPCDDDDIPCDGCDRCDTCGRLTAAPWFFSAVPADDSPTVVICPPCRLLLVGALLEAGRGPVGVEVITYR